MKAGDCKHFNGVQHRCCKAGVNYVELTRAATTWASGLPCLRVTAPAPKPAECSKFEASSLEDEAAKTAERDRVLRETAAGRSGCCGAPFDESQLITRGRHKGSGWIYCSKCGKPVMHVHA